MTDTVGNEEGMLISAEITTTLEGGTNEKAFYVD